jgi:hypothetical protein
LRYNGKVFLLANELGRAARFSRIDGLVIDDWA